MVLIIVPWLCVGIVSWFETQFFNAKLFEELVKHPNQVSQSQVSVSYHSLRILTIFCLVEKKIVTFLDKIS